MNKHDMIEYYSHYNRREWAEMEKHYTDDVLFYSANKDISGKELVEYYTYFEEYFYEVINPLTILFGKDLSGKDRIFVEMHNYIKCTKDGGEYLKVNYKAGDLVVDRIIAVSYILRDGKICRIVPYSFE